MEMGLERLFKQIWWLVRMGDEENPDRAEDEKKENDDSENSEEKRSQ